MSKIEQSIVIVFLLFILLSYPLPTRSYLLPLDLGHILRLLSSFQHVIWWIQSIHRWFEVTDSRDTAIGSLQLLLVLHYRYYPSFTPVEEHPTPLRHIKRVYFVLAILHTPYTSVEFPIHFLGMDPVPVGHVRTFIRGLERRGRRGYWGGSEEQYNGWEGVVYTCVGDGQEGHYLPGRHGVHPFNYNDSQEEHPVLGGYIGFQGDRKHLLEDVVLDCEGRGRQLYVPNDYTSR